MDREALEVERRDIQFKEVWFEMAQEKGGFWDNGRGRRSS